MNMGTPLDVSDALSYSEEDLAPMGGAHVVVRAKPAEVRRQVMIGRLQRALEVSPVDGVIGKHTLEALDARMGGGPWGSLEDRLSNLAELRLPGEIAKLIGEQWKANGPVQGW